MTVKCPLVGPFNFLNHACQDHCNLSWRCVSGRRYGMFLKKLAKKGGHMFINYYAAVYLSDLSTPPNSARPM
eukprot:6944416-Ditylum_brightwellii.AAC.1